MKRFAALYERLDETRSTQAKLDALAAYFAEAPPADAAWGLWLLLGHRLKRLIAAPRLREWAGTATGLAPAIVEECYAQVGDLAETLALLLDRDGKPPAVERGLADWVAWLQTLREVDEAAQREALIEAWRRLPLAQCFLLNKLLTGALRVGVSSGLAAKALARHAKLSETLIAQRLMGEWLRLASTARSSHERPARDGGAGGDRNQERLAKDGFSVDSTEAGRRAPARAHCSDERPARDRFIADSTQAWHRLLAAPEEGRQDPSQPYPFCLAAPLEDAPENTWHDGLPSGLGDASAFLAEWKWDGIRGQLIRRTGQCFLWSRGEELLTGRFPEVETAAARLPDGCVLDGEILAHDGARVLPFATLQRRIGRKQVGRKLLADAPVAFVAYDLLELEGEDWRERPLAARRERLEALIEAHGGERLRVSERIEAPDWETLREARAGSRERGVEGLMLKRLDSPYLAGRRRGAWWKWKIEAMTIDCVLVYAQSGHGRRATLYTDYTLSVWSGERGGEDELVPVAKAYSGLTDAELIKMDAWIKRHTREKFGPVRSVEPVQVFEIAFEGIQESTRHKAGIALRFPRIARWRLDKPATEANTLGDLKAFLRR